MIPLCISHQLLFCMPVIIGCMHAIHMHCELLQNHVQCCVFKTILSPSPP